VKIAVCVKHVPSGRVRFHPETLRIDRTGPGELNAFDKYPLEAAARLAEADGHEVVAVSVGAPAAEETLRTALSLGADRAVLVSDPAAAGSDLVATARLLAAALAGEAPDLALFGQQSSDGGGAALWAAVAEMLRVPFVSQASELTIDGSTLRVRRETEYGDDFIEAPLPAVVAVSDAINEPRYASLKGRMAAKKKPLVVLTAAELGLDVTAVGDAGSPSEVLAAGTPPTRTGRVTLDDEATAAASILEYLVDRELV
jgi:electron transfer flavoprotein beta subunit